MRIIKENLSIDELYDKLEQTTIDLAEHDFSETVLEWHSAGEPVFQFFLSNNLSFKIYVKGETYAGGMFAVATSYLELQSGSDKADVLIGDREIGEVEDIDFYETYSREIEKMLIEGNEYLSTLKIKWR